MGHGPQGRRESDTSERLTHTQTHTHTDAAEREPWLRRVYVGSPAHLPRWAPRLSGDLEMLSTCRPQQLGSHRATGTKASSAPTGVLPDSLGLSFGQSPLATRGIGSSPGQGWRKISLPAHLRPKKTHSKTENSELAPIGPSK